MAKTLESAASSTPSTLLLPNDDAFAAAQDPLDVALSLLPSADAKAAFLANLLAYHVLTPFSKAKDILVSATLLHTLTPCCTVTPLCTQ